MVNLCRRLGVASIIDALATSAAMFLVQLALMLLGSKNDYGAYNVFFSYVLAGQMALSSIFGAPLITSASALKCEERRTLLRKAVFWQACAIVIFSVLAVIGSYCLWPAVPPVLLATSVASFIGTGLREIQRTSWIIELTPERASLSSAAFGALILLILAAAYVSGRHLTAGEALAAVGIASGSVAIVPFVHSLGRAKGPGPSFASTVFVHVRWTAPGVMVIWLQNNLYLTIVAALLTLSAVAELSASRLIAVPYLVAASGLLRLNQVRFRQLIDAGAIHECVRLARIWSAIHLAICFALAAALASVAALGVASFLPTKFPKLLPLASLWLLFAGVSTARGVFSSLFQAQGEYKTILIVNFVTMPVVLAAFFAVPRIGITGAILPLIAAEALFLGILLHMSPGSGLIPIWMQRLRSKGGPEVDPVIL